jgi:hypothetical protein
MARSLGFASEDKPTRFSGGFMTIEMGDEIIDVHASEVTSRERDTLYGRQAELYLRFGDYQRQTKRIIPVLALTRRK